MKIIIDDGLYVPHTFFSNEDRRNLIQTYYTFTRVEYKNKLVTLNLSDKVNYEGNLCWKLPPNLSFFKNCCEELGLDYGEILDKRVAPKIEGLNTTIKLRPLQETLHNKVVASKYEALITASTGFGKTTYSLFLAEQLQTTMLFIATRVSLLENLIKDCVKFGIDSSLITRVDTEWLSNPVVTPIMYCSAQALNNDEIIATLKDKIGLLIIDEIHLGTSSDITRNNIFNINSKYNIYLSATPENQFKGSVRAIFSDNIVDAEEDINFNITINNFDLDCGKAMFSAYYEDDLAYHSKKDVVYSHMSYMEKVAEIAAYLVHKKGRGVLIYVENNKAHNILQSMLEEYGLKVGLLNANTKKAETKNILNTFDLGEYDVLVSGNAISAGVSLYRLSTIIDISLTLNSNNLTQLLGRLKRVDAEICEKSKEYLKITIPRISDRKWAKDKSVLKGFDYLIWNETFKATLNDDLLEFLNNKF